MTTLKFADTYNMVAFLSKPAESKGFEQIATVKAKTVNGEVQLQALVDGKKIIITESTVRRDLQLEDAEGVDCLPNATIFEQLALMGYESGRGNTIISKQRWYNNQEVNSMKVPELPRDPHHTPTSIQPSPQPQKTQKPRSPKKKDTQVPQSSVPGDNVTGEAVYKELDDSLVRAATTASSLEAEQDNGGGPRRQETMGDTIAQTRVLDLEKTKTTQVEEIVSLKRRVKKLEQKKRSRTHGLKRLYKVGLTARVESSRDEESLGEDASKQGRINAIDADEDITLVNDQDDADMFDVNTLAGDEVLAEQEVAAAKDVNLTVDEVTLAQALVALKSVKPKVKANVIEEPSVPVSAVSASTKVSAATTTTAIIPTLRKGIVIAELEEPVNPKKKDLIRFDEEIASKLQAEFDEEERLAREKDEANVVLTEEWDDIQAKIEADHELAQRLQAKEQEGLPVEEKAKLFQQLLEQRKKHFAAKRAEEKRNKPPTQAQQRKIMCTYLKNMEGKKPKDLKNKSFDSIQKMFDRAFKRVNTFMKIPSATLTFTSSSKFMPSSINF
ncbi:hypothetical protein Tco_1237108 [Tanacetum coccineum]